MTDEQIRILLSLGADEARLLLENGECALHMRIQRKMVKLVRNYDGQLPLNCLQFVYCEKRLFKKTGLVFKWGSAFLNLNSQDKI
jgi:pyruvate formate-lyase activating enzyme-like uncharacterized protein